ncbi:MAG: T9SS type A sorting domain-containing protein [Bacteroidetes bacterium]|nr:T9SS type A sorting domain-containing protein [Bacteroidota bacterium]
MRILKRVFGFIFSVNFIFGFSFGQSIFPNGKNIYSTALHVHALSNHNGSITPASMQYQNNQANKMNVDAIWFTEHWDFWKQQSAVQFKFNNATILSNGDISIPNGTSTSPKTWKLQKAGGIHSVSFDSQDGFNINFQSNSSSSTYQYVGYNPKNANGSLLQGTAGFVKPMTSHPYALIQVFCTNLPSTGHIRPEITFLLAYHNRGTNVQQKIIYRFVNSFMNATKELLSPNTVLVTVPIAVNVWNSRNLDLYADASLMQDGNDNTLSDYNIKVSTRSLQSTLFKFKFFKICSDDAGQSNLAEERQLANSYSNEYGIKNFVSSEFSPGAAATHINSYYPVDTLPLDVLIDYGNKTNYDLFVQRTAAVGGITSMCHPFGVKYTPQQSDSVLDSRTDSLMNLLVTNNVYGVNMIEVGYAIRGYADMKHHLKLWDKLTNKGRLVYGVGANDNHGGTWKTLNSMSTIIWSQTDDAANLVDALSNGYMYAANMKLWKNKFFFQAGGVPMGARVASPDSVVYLRMSALSLPPNSKVRLTQGLIDSSANVHYIHDALLINPVDSFMLDISQPNFVRIAIYDQYDNPVVISNPIVFYGFNHLRKAQQEVVSLSKFQLSAYPNPAGDFVNLAIDIPQSINNVTITVYDELGRAVIAIPFYEFTSGKNNFTIDTSALKSGLYHISFESKEYRGETNILKQ